MKKTIDISVREIEEKINYTFKDKSLLIQAFTRTSYCNEVNPTVKTKLHSNEVLEFFGDGVLSLSIISFLLKECTERYEHGIKTELNEGDFSNIKSKLSDKQNLSKSMKALGLEKYLLMGEGDIKLGIQNEPSVMEDLFESIVGAIFIDSGMNIVTVINSVSRMLDMSVYTNRQKVAQSAKNALQEWCADKKHRLPAPRYETLSEDGPDHKKTYMRACYIGDKLVGRGIGKNFKLADAAAAEDALKALMAQEEQILQTKVSKSEDNGAPNKENKNQTNQTSKVKETANDTNTDKLNAQQPAIKKPSPAAALIKSYAASAKKASPVFKDLGEKKNGQKTEYAVECCFANETALGVGQTRTEARENACKQMAEKLGLIKKKSSPKKTSASHVKKVAEAPKAANNVAHNKEKGSVTNQIRKSATGRNQKNRKNTGRKRPVKEN